MLGQMFGGKKSKSAKRTFKVVSVVNKDGCETKFNPGRYTGTHRSAARKAFTKLCHHKKVKGVCSLYISVQETTQGSGKVEVDDNKKGKVVKKCRIYKVDRVKLTKPVVMLEGTKDEFFRKYETKSKSVKSVPKCTVSRPRTRGVMKKYSRTSNGKKRSARQNNKNNNRSHKNNNRRMKKKARSHKKK